MSEKFTGFTPPFTIIDDEIYDAKGFLLTSCLTNNQLNYITQRLNTYDDIQKQTQGLVKACKGDALDEAIRILTNMTYMQENTRFIKAVNLLVYKKAKIEQALSEARKGIE